jgi:hypothetical protein
MDGYYEADFFKTCIRNIPVLRFISKTKKLGVMKLSMKIMQLDVIPAHSSGNANMVTAYTVQVGAKTPFNEEL